jgi:PmbA protein
MQKHTAPHSPAQGFSYSRPQFESFVDTALAHAKKLGATDAGAEASEGCGLSVSARLGKLENVERNRDKSLGITVYIGKKRGNASTSDFSTAAIEQTVHAAYDIARFTAEDPVAGLPDLQDVATKQPELDLFHPWDVNSEQALELALRCEAAAMGVSKKITNSEGAGVSAIFSPAICVVGSWVFVVAMHRRAIRCLFPLSRAKVPICSAMVGTAQCAMPAIWPAPMLWVSMHRSGH